MAAQTQNYTRTQVYGKGRAKKADHKHCYTVAAIDNGFQVLCCNHEGCTAKKMASDVQQKGGYW